MNLWSTLPHRTSFHALLAGLLAAVLVPGLLLGGLHYFGWVFVAPWALLAACLAVQVVALGLWSSRWFARRVGHPVRELAHLANAMAAGQLDRALPWHGGDELGRLAACLEQARQSMQHSGAEQRALFDRLPCGVLMVRNRVIEFSNARAEALLGFPAGHLAGCVTEVIYLARDDFYDIGARAYAAVEQGKVFSEAVWLRRHDGERLRAILSGCALDVARANDASVWTITPLLPQAEHAAGA